MPLRNPTGAGAFPLAAAALITTVLAASCGPGTNGSAKDAGAKQAIQAILDRDTELGTIRNHASESGTLAQAVQNYVRGLAELDFSDCPPDFTAAFERHREAWRVSEAFFEDHAPLRGEMHDLFEEIRSRGGAVQTELEALEREIWGTWAKVEAAVERYGAGS